MYLIHFQFVCSYSLLSSRYICRSTKYHVLLDNCSNSVTHLTDSVTYLTDSVTSWFSNVNNSTIYISDESKSTSMTYELMSIIITNIAYLSSYFCLHNNNNNNSMLIVQYPMQISGPLRHISNPCLRRRMVVQLTQLVLMHFMHYYYLLINITK